MRDAGLDPGGTIAMNRVTFGRPIQPLLQFGKMFRGFVFFAVLNQGHQFLLGVAGGLQKSPVDLAAAKRGAGLFGGGSGVGHKRKECPKRRAPVNP